MDTAFRILTFSPRLTLAAFFLMFGAIGGVVSGHSGASESQRNNPWSKNYVASSSSSRVTKGAWDSERSSAEGGVFEARERAEDERFRRQMLREMREEYERDHGEAGSDRDE